MRFEKYDFLTDESTNRNRLITITNWDIYQQDDCTHNSQTNRQLTGNQQATNRQLTAKKECKNNKNDKKEIKPPYPLTEFGFSLPLQEKIEEWLTYKTEKKDTYKPTGFRSLMKRIAKQTAEYGDQVVMDLIDECMAANWKGIIWDRIEKQSKVKVSANPFDELLRKELQNEQSGNHCPHENNQRLLSGVLPEG